MILIKKILEIIGMILILIFVGFFGIGSAIFMFLDKNMKDSDDSEIEDFRSFMSNRRKKCLKKKK